MSVRDDSKADSYVTRRFALRRSYARRDHWSAPRVRGSQWLVLRAMGSADRPLTLALVCSASSSLIGCAVTAGALRGTHLPGEREGFLLVYSPDLAQRRYLSYDGIPGEYANRSNTVAPEGIWVVVGTVWHLNPFPATSGLDATINGTHGAFFRVLNPGP